MGISRNPWWEVQAPWSELRRGKTICAWRTITWRTQNKSQICQNRVCCSPTWTFSDEHRATWSPRVLSTSVPQASGAAFWSPSSLELMLELVPSHGLRQQPACTFGDRCCTPDACSSVYITEGIHRTAFGIQLFCIRLPGWPQIHISILLLLHLLDLLMILILSSISKIFLLQLLCHLSSSCSSLISRSWSQ